MICVFLLANLIYSKEVQICICQNLNCQQYAGCSETNTLDPVNELTSKDFYDRIQSLMIGCTDVDLIIRRSSGSFVPEMRLIQFSGKSVKITESCLNNAPREGVKFQYANNEDYSRIQLVSLNAKIIFTPFNNESKSLALTNFILYDSSYSSVEFNGNAPESSSNTITSTDNSIILSKLLIFNQIFLNASNIPIYIDNSQCQLLLHDGYFEYKVSSESNNVYYLPDSTLNFNRAGTDPGIMFLNNVDINNYANIPKFTTTNVDEIGISGTWPDPPSTSYSDLISIGDLQTDTKISVISEKVPFNFYGRNLEMTIITSTTFFGQIEARTLLIRRTTNEVATVVIPKLTSELKITSPNVSITIEDYTYTGYGIPTTASFSGSYVSKLTVNKFTRLNTITEFNLNVYSFFTSEISSGQIVQVFENYKDFLILPYEDWMTSSDVLIVYESSSSDREGFTNQYSIVNVKVTETDGKAVFSFNLQGNPSDPPVRRNFCYDNECSASDPIVGAEIDLSQYLTGQTDYIFTICSESFLKGIKFDLKSISTGEYNFVFRPYKTGKIVFIELDGNDQSLSHVKSITIEDDLRCKMGSKFYTNTLIIKNNAILLSPDLHVPNIQIDYTVDDDYISNYINQDNSPLKNLVINAEGSSFYSIKVKDSDVTFTMNTDKECSAPLKSSYELSFLTNNVFMESAITSALSGSFSVDFTKNSIITLNKFTLSAAKNSKIKLNHGDNELTINYDIGTEFASNFELIGHGYVSQNINYGASKEYCLCSAKDDANCQGCASGSTKLYYDTFSSSLKDDKNIKLTIQPPSSESASPTIPVSLLRNKKVELTSTKPVNVNLDIDDTEISNENFIISGKVNIQSDSQSSELKFDVLDISSLEGEIGLSTIRLTVNKLSCKLAQIEKFSSFNVLNEIKVKVEGSDTNPTFEKNVEIDAGTDFYDLTIDFDFNQNPFTFTFGEGYMKLGNVKFIIERTEYLDIVVTPGANFNFNINLEKGVDIKNVPLARFNMNNEYGIERNVYFNENWVQSDSEILSFIVGNSVSFYFKSLVPMGIQMNKFVVHHFYVDQSTITNVGIQFGVTIDQNLGSDVNTYTDGWKIHETDSLTSSKTFCVKSPIKFVHNCESFSIASDSAKVSLLINNILNDNSGLLKVNVKLPLDSTKVSSLTLEETLTQVVLNDVTLEATIENTVDIDNVLFLKENITIINGKFTNLLELIDENRINYVNIAENPAYGTSTTTDIVGFTISQDQRKINFGRIKQLSEGTFVAQFERQMNTEIIKDVSLVITDSRNIVPILNSNIPGQIKSIYLYITDNLYATDIIDFRQFSTEKFQSKIDFVLDGVSLKRYSAPIILGPIINTLTITNINLLVPELPESSSLRIKDDQISIEKIKFIDSSVPKDSLSIDGTVQNVETDTDTFSSILNNEVITTNYQGKVKMTSSNYITFTKDGWIVRENSWKDPVTISASNSLSDRIQFEGYDEITLLIDPEAEDMTEVKRPDLSIVSTKGDDKVTVHVGTGWRKITNANELNINAGKNELDIYTASYPLDNMFSTQNYSISLDSSIGQQTGTGSGSQVDFDLGDEYVLDNVQDLDMTSIQNEKDRVLHANLIRCTGQSSQISFTNNLGQVQVEDLVVENESYAQLPKTTVRSKIEMIESAILSIDLLNEPSLGFEFKWRYNKMPELTLLSEEQLTFTPSINVVFNSDESEENLNKSYYNNLLINMKFELIRGNFDCEVWKSHSKFTSSIEKFSSNSGDDCVFQFECIKSKNDDVLQAKTVNLFDIPLDTGDDDNKDDNKDDTSKDEDPKPKKSLSTGAVVGIVIACAFVAATVASLIVFIVIRKKYEKAMENENIELAEGNTDGVSTA